MREPAHLASPLVADSSEDSGAEAPLLQDPQDQARVQFVVALGGVEAPAERQAAVAHREPQQEVRSTRNAARAS
eukprot:9676235-Alexandrium_andersonii.AAC.1